MEALSQLSYTPFKGYCVSIIATRECPSSQPVCHTFFAPTKTAVAI